MHLEDLFESTFGKTGVSHEHLPLHEVGRQVRFFYFARGEHRKNLDRFAHLVEPALILLGRGQHLFVPLL